MPRCWLFSTITLTGSFSQWTVASSWMFMTKLPSPSMSTTSFSGKAACIPIAAGRP